MGHVSLGWKVVAVLACLGVLPAAARAQTGTACAGSTAQELYGHGQDAYAVGQYDRSAACWEAAYAMDPRPAIQHNLATVYERLGRLEDAIHALEVFVQATTVDDAGNLEANARLAALRARLAATGVRLSGGPVGGTITIDEQAWGLTPRPDPIAVRPGAHVVEIVYPNGQRFRSTLQVVAGQVLEVPIRDADLTAPTAPRPVETARAAAPTPHGHGMLYAGIGASVVGVGMLAYGLERNAKLANCEAPYYCAEADIGRRERAAGLAIGSASLAAGAALIVVDLLRGRHEEQTVACAPTGLGGTCRVTF